MVRDSQDGLEWNEIGLDLVPGWTREPSLEAIESVCRRQLGIPPEEPCTVSFYAAGAFNKLYLVSSANPTLMRVSLPVHPHLKTRGEVATLQWVRDNTDIPVPKVLAFQDSNENEVGFEWILMELMPGKPAYRRWRTMSMGQKAALTDRFAEYQAQLSRTTFKNIGTLDADAGKFVPGQLISHEFFMGDHLRYDVPRGPFRSSHDWLRSELNITILEQTAAMEKAEDEDDREDAEEILHAAQKLLSVLPKVFPETQDSPEVTAIWHDDLNLRNILVDDEGEVTAVVDWECVSALPIWMAAKMPGFLKGGNRQEEPKRETYGDETPQGTSASEQNVSPDDLDNEGKNELYWIHLMEYEVTRLQEVYDAKLRQLWPDRPVEEDNRVKLDFFEAMLQCSYGFRLKQVGTWVDSLERGEFIRWVDA